MEQRTGKKGEEENLKMGKKKSVYVTVVEELGSGVTRGWKKVVQG